MSFWSTIFCSSLSTPTSRATPDRSMRPRPMYVTGTPATESAPNSSKGSTAAIHRHQSGAFEGSAHQAASAPPKEPSADSS